MHISGEYLDILFAIEEQDVTANRAMKQLESLPQRQLILQCRKKSSQLQEKMATLKELALQVGQKLADVEAEDDKLLRQRAQLQAEIDELKGDFRSVTARSVRLDGIAKRRATLAQNHDELSAEDERINTMRAQVQSALDQVKAKETQATEAFVELGSQIKRSALDAQAKSKALGEALPPDLLKLYLKTAEKCAGVALSKLEGANCGTCRSAIEYGQLLDMRSQGNVSICPHCGRILVLEE